MADPISVMIADDNVQFCSMLHEYLGKTGDILVKGVANNGVDAVDSIIKLSPDIVVLDVIMPRLDGIGVLETISEMKIVKRPAFIVLATIGKDIVVRQTMELGADYYLMKPVDMDILISHIRRLGYERAGIRPLNRASFINPDLSARQYGANNAEKVIAGMIMSMGITPNIVGYRYLRDAVVFLANQPTLMGSPVKYVYAVVAKHYNTTARNVSRAIRCAILSAYRKSEKNVGKGQNTIMIIGGDKKNTDGEIIELLAEKAIQHMTQVNSPRLDSPSFIAGL